MLQHVRPALVLTLLFTFLTGVVYPLAITGLGTVVFPQQAQGSLITRNGAIVGSSLVGQYFAAERYFHARPSATSRVDPSDASKTVDEPYNAASSSGSNLGPLSQKLIDRVAGEVERVKVPGPAGIPADAVTTSASGLDPHISPAFAAMQISRVATARGWPEERVERIVAAKTEGRLFGLIGEPRVNVLLLNLALDEVQSQ
ncbi:MAG: potassium-transporting ATPase subunit KdpC [Beijerinckiaceae bacterium]|nr:potassium-transporting ATPase subunit KdpC [Beijerinckiaceae bacterium]